MKRNRASEKEAERYGFRWGQLDVVRMSDSPNGAKWLRVSTEFSHIDLYVSPKGRRITEVGHA